MSRLDHVQLFSSLVFIQTFCLKKCAGTERHFCACNLQCRNVPVDFQLVSSSEPSFFTAATLCKNHEFLREYFGLDVWKFMELVYNTKVWLLTQPDFGEVTNEKLAGYLCEKVNFESRRQPNALKVSHLLQIHETLRKAPKAKRAIQLATAEFGRSTLFEDFSKVLTLCQRCRTPADLEYVAEGLASTALRTQNSDPPSKTSLLHKSGEIATWQPASTCFQILLFALYLFFPQTVFKGTQ